MNFEDIQHKYLISPEIGEDFDYTGRQVLLKLTNPGHVFIGAFKDETTAKNVALALEFYKQENLTSEEKTRSINSINEIIRKFWNQEFICKDTALEEVYDYLQHYYPTEFPTK